MEARRADDHRQYHHLLSWLSCPFVMRVAQRLACGIRAAASHDLARVTSLTLLVTGMLSVLVQSCRLSVMNELPSGRCF